MRITTEGAELIINLKMPNSQANKIELKNQRNEELKRPKIDNIHQTFDSKPKSNHLRSGGPTMRAMNPILVPIVALVSMGSLLMTTVRGQCPVNTMTSFERIGGVTIKDSPLTVLYTAPSFNSSSSLASHQQIFTPDPSRQIGQGNSLSISLSGGSAFSSGMSAMNIPITAECNNRCRRSARCRAFLVDYSRHTCFSVEQPPSQGQMGLLRGPTPIHLVPTHERTAYFEKVCLNLPSIDCERAWIYERVMGHQIQGHDNKIIQDVPSRMRCQEHCLNEREFRCRSGEYDYLTMQCRLSLIDRHIKPDLFRPTSSSVDYFENQCAPVGNQCDAFDRYEDLDIGRAEIMRSANTSDQCQQFCTQTIKAFICRSFTWNPATGRCYLNNVNTFMVGGLDKLISAPGLVYFQRNDCIDLRLECDTNAMTLNLRTNEPFRGRMYVRDEPNSCETIGRSALSSSLSIPFQPLGRCAQRELPSRFSSVVVVQQHPLIQRKSDRYIKVVCDFQTSNKTITSSYDIVANAWTSTALINATSFAPKIRLRITDKFGVDITGAKLGDELYLRIEAESDSVYDMVARSVFAKSGTTDESIMLIDKDGCPTDFRIFPALKKQNRRTIIGKFDAFKFSSDVVVRFQVDVQFCLNQCPSISCDSSLQLLNTNMNQLGQAAPDTYTAGDLTTMSPQQLDAQGSTHSPPIRSNPMDEQSQNSNESPQSYQQNRPNGYLDNRYPSVPANAPMSNNFSSSSSPMLNPLSSATGSESQVFDENQARGLALGQVQAKLDSNVKGHSEFRAMRPSDQNQASAGSKSSQQEAAIASNSESSSSNGSQRRRRRRSAEPIPSSPGYVPLHRDIIVEPSAGGDAARKAKQTAAGVQRDARESHSKSINRSKQTETLDFNGNRPEAIENRDQHSDNNGKLLCTTRHSLVLASLALCTVQLLAISFCLVTWIHKKDTKFKFQDQLRWHKKRPEFDT